MGLWRVSLPQILWNYFRHGIIPGTELVGMWRVGKKCSRKDGAGVLVRRYEKEMKRENLKFHVYK